MDKSKSQKFPHSIERNEDLKLKFNSVIIGWALTSRTVIDVMQKCKDTFKKLTIQVGLQTLHSFSHLTTYFAKP